MSAWRRGTIMLAGGVLLVGSLASAAIPKSPGGTTGRTTFDDMQSVNINQVSMIVMNNGSIAFNPVTLNAGLEYPKGSGMTAVFAAGLWLGAIVDGGIRTTVSDYSSDWRPGNVVGGVAADPSLAQYKVYRLERVYLNTPARDAALADYNAGAVPYGAPPVSVLGDGTLSVLGDQMLWSVYNDLGKLGVNPLSSLLPVGIEVQQTTWASDVAGSGGRMVFTRYRMIQRGASPATNMFFGFWTDPDLGGFADDLVGCDTTLSLAYCYNATNSDLVYGSAPPAFGVRMTQGPYSSALGARLQATAVIGYVNGGDPVNSVEAYRSLSGLNRDGTPIINPTTGQPTRFMYSGDPVAATGWLDSSPSDRRVMLSSGPFSMAPGDTQEVVIAIVIGQASNRLASLTALRFSTSVLDATRPLPARLALGPPQPNPGRGVVTLSLSLPTEGEATLELLDIAGRRVHMKSLGSLPAGTHAIPLDLARVRRAPGIYFVRVTHHEQSVTQRLVVLD